MIETQIIIEEKDIILAIYQKDNVAATIRFYLFHDTSISLHFALLTI